MFRVYIDILSWLPYKVQDIILRALGARSRTPVEIVFHSSRLLNKSTQLSDFVYSFKMRRGRYYVRTYCENYTFRCRPHEVHGFLDRHADRINVRKNNYSSTK